MKTVVAYKQKYWPLQTTCPKCNHSFVRNTYIKDRKKANCDAELTLDVVRFGVRKKYDEIICFSGDGDFSIVYEYVSKELHKKVTVYSPLGSVAYRTSSKLKKLDIDGVIELRALNNLLQHYAEK